MQNLFERWGEFVVRRPVSVLVWALVLVAVGVVGVSRITASNSLQQIFVSGSPAYARYDAMRALFPPSQMDAVIVISDPELMTPERLEALRSLQFDLSLQEGVTGVVSLFSARRADEGDTFPSIVPNDIPEGAAFAALVEEIVTHPLVRNRLVSADADTVLFNVGLDPAAVEAGALQALVAQLRRSAEANLAPHGLEPILTGDPVMRAELDVINAYEEIMLAVAGFLVAGLVCLAYFRRISFTLLSGTVPAATVVMTFGLLGWLQIPLTISLQIVAPLVTVIAFNNAMHMLFAILHSRSGNDPAISPVAHAVGEVGPASLMTSLTSAIAFGALTLTDSDVIRAFGALAAFGTAAAFLAVITIIPALATLVIRWRGTAFLSERQSDGGRLAAGCTAADNRARRHALAIVAGGALLFAVFAYAQSTLVPRYLFKDNMPFASETRTAIATIDDAFGGSQPLRVLVRWPANDPQAEAALMGHLAALEERLQPIPAIGSVLSLATLNEWLAAARPDTDGDLDALLDALPETLTRLMIERAAGVALVTAMVPDQSSEANRLLVGEIGAALDGFAPAAPGFDFEITGIVALTAVETGRIINSLQLSLLAAIVVIIGLIGLTFRHIWPAAISVLPNVFPIVAGGAFLALLGGDITFAGAIAMTVAFGLAVDDTIHMLYRFRREHAKLGSVELALERTMTKIGPVLVVSTLVLVAGMSVLFLSELPMNHDYARLTIFIFGAALVGDLVLLPALIRVFHRKIIREDISTLE